MRTLTVDITIPIGQGALTLPADFVGKQGVVTHAALFEAAAPSKPINIKVDRQSGDLLIDETPGEDWIQRAGSYTDSKKPMGFETQQIVVKVSSDAVQIAEYKAKLTFYIAEKI